MTFKNLGLIEELNQALCEQNYLNTTKIQKVTIPKVLENKDLIVQGQTGSGKTASFVLPILQSWYKSINKEKKKRKIHTLVLTPTRELALQVANSFKIFSKYFKVNTKIIGLIGGESLGKQLLELQQGIDFVVATTGRLNEIISKQQIDLRDIKFFVLDEADKMLNEGFEQELDVILKNINIKRQNLLFSATYSEKIKDLIKKVSNNYEAILNNDNEIISKELVQKAIKINKDKRSALLVQILKENSYKKVLVFMANKKASDNIAFKFRKKGFEAESFHGDLVQDDRNYTLDEFKNENINVLFCTDIASRGLHIDNVDCVINYDLPRSTADYVHRIGRTARAGKSGQAISFINEENYEHFKLIKKKNNLSINLEEVKTFEFKGEFIKKQKGQAPIKSKRKSKKDKLREQGNKKIKCNYKVFLIYYFYMT